MVVAGASEEMRGFFAGLRMTSKRATADSSAALRNDKQRVRRGMAGDCFLRLFGDLRISFIGQMASNKIDESILEYLTSLSLPVPGRVGCVARCFGPDG